MKKDKRIKYDIDDYIGASFSDWTVVSFSHKSQQREQYWNVKCVCGSLNKVSRTNLFRGSTTKCKKCMELGTRGSKNSQWKGGNFISQSFLQSYKTSAKDRKINFLLKATEVEDLFYKQDGKCKYSGKELTFSDVQSGPNFDRVKNQTASLDRIDSSKGYTLDNVQFVHKTVNTMKWDFTEEKFLSLIKKIYKHSVKKNKLI